VVVRSSLAGVVGAALLLAAAPAVAAAKPPTPQLIDQAEHGGRLGHARAQLYRAYAIGAPERLPAPYRSNAPWDGTLTLLHLHRDLPKLRPADREKVQAVLRPPASGPSCSSSSGTQTNTLATTHFHITYNSVSAGLTAQDYADSLESSWGTEINSFGWAAPPVYTTNPAPGNRYYVRIDSLGSGLYGYVAPSGTYAGPVGDNPATSWNDVDAYASCMVLNSNYDPSVFPSSAQASLDSTTAHEFNHSIQYGIGGLSGANLPDDVFVEGGATWMEDEAQDSANDNYNYLWPVFADSMGDYDASPYPYWITFRGLTERYGAGVAGGGEQVMQDFWELTSQGPQSNLQAMNTALGARGTTLADAFHAYAIAVKFNHTCSGGWAYPYCFEEAAGYLANAGPTAVAATVASVGGSATSSVEDNYALRWIALPSSASLYDVTVQNTSSGGQLRGTVACVTSTGLVLSTLPGVLAAGQAGTLQAFDPSGCTSRVLVVTNQSQTAPNPTSSTARSFSVSTGTAAPGSHSLSVAKTGTGNGTVTSTPGGINCGNDCSQAYTDGTSVTLTATAAPGSSFTGWSGDCSGSTASCTVSMSDSRAVTATFDLLPVTPTHSLSVAKSGSGSGTVTSTPAGINCGSDCSQNYTDGTSVTLTATPAAGSRFSGWSGACSGSTASCTISMSGSRAVTATFALVTVTSPTEPPPTGGSPTGSTPPPDVLAPAIAFLRLDPTRFRAARSGRAMIASLVGTRVAIRLSEAATVTFRVVRIRPDGSRVRLRGKIVRELAKGTTHLRYRGRINGHRLKPGRYRLVARARDAAGNVSTFRRAKFRILG
jgi:hypothetical protein